MNESMALVRRDDTASTEDADKFVVWATQFDGVDAHVILDYVRIGDEFVPGAVNGVTLQWAHGWDHEFAGTEAQVGDVALVATTAVHVPVGATATRTPEGFTVAFERERLVDGEPVVFVVTRTAAGETEARA